MAPRWDVRGGSVAQFSVNASTLQDSEGADCSYSCEVMTENLASTCGELELLVSGIRASLFLRFGYYSYQLQN